MHSDLHLTLTCQKYLSFYRETNHQISNRQQGIENWLALSEAKVGTASSHVNIDTNESNIQTL